MAVRVCFFGRILSYPNVFISYILHVQFYLHYNVSPQYITFSFFVVIVVIILFLISYFEIFLFLSIFGSGGVSLFNNP